MKTIKLMLLAAMAVCLAGCNPDDIEFTVLTDDLKSAMNGEIGEADCVVTFDTSMAGDNLRSHIPDIKSRVQPLLGAKGRINVRGDKLVASFKAKVVGKASVIVGKEGPYRIVVQDGIVSYTATPTLATINSVVKDINFSLGFEDKPKQITWRVSSGDIPATVGAIAVFVDGQARLNYQELIADDIEREIVFSRDSHSVYSQVPIMFTIAYDSGYYQSPNGKHEHRDDETHCE